MYFVPFAKLLNFNPSPPPPNSTFRLAPPTLRLGHNRRSSRPSGSGPSPIDAASIYRNALSISFSQPQGPSCSKAD